MRATDIERAESAAFEQAMCLQIPRFARDLAMGWARLGDPASFDEGVILLQRVIARLKPDAPLHVRLPTEPNYVAVAYDCLVIGAEEMGRPEAQAAFEEERDAWAATVAELARKVAQEKDGGKPLA